MPRPLTLALTALLGGCGAVTVHLPDNPPSPRCMLIAPVKSSLFIPAGSADQDTPRPELRARVLEVCKEEARDAGGNVLYLTDRVEKDSVEGKGFTVHCSGMAYACP